MNKVIKLLNKKETWNKVFAVVGIIDTMLSFLERTKGLIIWLIALIK